jgi:tRNA threonylcarbamoyladenosine biosynthesis protein TsaB
LLALDTATDGCSCALYNQGQISALAERTPRGHSDLILPMIDQLLRDAQLKPTDLTALVFGQGPGSFTGLRIACGVTQGIAFAADLPVIPISDLAAMAQAAYRLHHARNVLVALDARMNQIYWGVYQADDAGLMQKVQAEQVINPESVIYPSGEWTAVGNGWAVYPHTHTMPTLSAVYPLAQDMLTLALPLAHNPPCTAARCRPVYLRDQVVQSPQAK